MTIEDLFTRYYGPIQRYIYSRLGNYEVSEDITQEVFIKAAEAIDTIYEGYASRWLFTIARNRCIDTIRRQRLIDFVEIEEWHKIADLPDIDTQEQIVRVWDTLPEHYQAAMYLYYMEDYSIRKIAATLHASPSTIKMRLMRGRNLFKEQYQAIEEVAA